MNPEQGLLIVLKHLTVKVLIILLTALIGMLCPKRLSFVQQLRALFDFQLNRLFLFFSLFLFRLNSLNDFICIQLFAFQNYLRLCSFCLRQINFSRHKGTVFLNHFSGLIQITEFQHIFVHKKGDSGAYLIFCAVGHGKFRSAVTFPVNSLRPLPVRKSIDMHFISHHEGRVKAQTKMSDNLILIRLILIFFDKIRSSRKSNLINIFFHFIGSHTDTIILKGQCLFLRIHNHLNFTLIVCGQAVFTHHVQFF